MKRKKKLFMHRRILAILLALIMCFGEFGVTAFAEGSDGTPEITADNTSNTENVENTESTENTDNTQDVENTENTENTDNTQDVENTDNTEDVENTENVENVENVNNVENVENTENAGNVDNADNVDNTGNAENVGDTEHQAGYAALEELEEAYNAVVSVIDSEEKSALNEAIDNYVSVYNRLSPEDQAGMKEQYDYVVSLRPADTDSEPMETVKAEDLEGANAVKEEETRPDEGEGLLGQFRAAMDAMEAFTLTEENQEEYRAMVIQASALLEALKGLEDHGDYLTDDDLARFQKLAAKEAEKLSIVEEPLDKAQARTRKKMASRAYVTYDTTVTLYPGDGAPTGTKMKLGDKWDGKWTVVEIDTKHVKFGSNYGEHNNSFKVPAPEDIWTGVSSNYKTVAGYSSAWNDDKHIGAQAQLIYTGGNATYKNVINTTSGGGSNPGGSSTTTPSGPYVTIIHQYYTNGKYDGESKKEYMSVEAPTYGTIGQTYKTIFTSNITSRKPTYNGTTYTYKTMSSNPTTVKVYRGDTSGNKGTFTLRYERTVTVVPKVTLTYKDGNEIFSGPTEYDKNSSVTVINCTNTRNNYEFLGWDTDPSADEVVYGVKENQTKTFTITQDTILYAVWSLKDDGGGISIEKTRVSVNGDTTATTAEKGDEIKWGIKVTNNSNVTKTVKLTEKLNGAYFTDTNKGEQTFTLAPGSSKTVTATYTVKAADAGKIVYNTVVGETNKPSEEKKDTDEGTPVSNDYVYSVEWYDADTDKKLPENIVPNGKNPETRKVHTTPGSTVSASANDKVISGYTYTVVDGKTAESAKLKDDGSTVLKLYFKKNNTPPPSKTDYTVTYSWAGLPEGTTDPAAPKGANYTEGTEITVDGRAKDSTVEIGGKTYVFSGWSSEDVTTVTSGGTFEMPGKDVEIKGSWAEKPGTPGPADTIYTVVHEYYTNGSLTGSTTQNGNNGKVGDVIRAANIGKIGRYDGNDYIYGSASSTSITLTEGGQNTIILRYYRTTGGRRDPEPTPTPSRRNPEPTTEPDPGTEPDLDPGTDPTPGPATAPVPVPSLVPLVATVDILETNVPLTNLPDEDVPLAGIPRKAEGLEVDIFDEEVPLSDVPKTGDDFQIWLLFALGSAAGLALLALKGRNRRGTAA